MNVISARRAEPLLEIRNLTICYREGERQVTAVRDVSFTLEPGGALAIVGESGSGKSSVAGAILDFLGPAAEVTGAILFEGQDLAELTPAQRRNILGRRTPAPAKPTPTAPMPATARPVPTAAPAPSWRAAGDQAVRDAWPEN